MIPGIGCHFPSCGRSFPEAEVGDLLAELANRSLLTVAGSGWYSAHDLQHDVLKRRLCWAGCGACPGAGRVP